MSTGSPSLQTEDKCTTIKTTVHEHTAGTDADRLFADRATLEEKPSHPYVSRKDLSPQQEGLGDSLGFVRGSVVLTLSDQPDSRLKVAQKVNARQTSRNSAACPADWAYPPVGGKDRVGLRAFMISLI
ncbi:hypothetical protein Q5P01_017602 [Channa striata]|uniref:Uncharacterized protein n=1 Tax=Channa striata TaxID=64152 RepID=A0AA88M9Z8_CHASR|nr:hypothetical protein Q5P01_017602 [Channa striata]